MLKFSLITFFVMGVLCRQSHAAIIISDFNISAHGVTFDIFGTLPNQVPRDERNSLIFANSNPAADPGFALGNFIKTTSINTSFTGSHRLSGRFPVSTGNSDIGDYFFVSFDRLSPGESINGMLTATWSAIAFDSSAVKNIDVYWGTNSSLSENPEIQPSIITGGTFLTTVAIPEPNTTLLAILGTLSLLRRSRKI